MAVTRIINACPDGCPVCDQVNYSFCGSDTVEAEICLVPAIEPALIANVLVEVDPLNFKVELICCNFIVVCGFITKKITFIDGKIKRKDLIVQIKVPADICNADYLRVDAWNVTGVEVCAGCYGLICPDNSEPTRFHKLIEKDIIAVQVDSIVPLPPQP